MPNKEPDWEQLEKWFAEDCEITNNLMDTEGRTCALGKLLKEAGVRPEIVGMVEVIESRYGLTSSEQNALVDANDSELEDVTERRLAVIAALHKIREARHHA